MHALGFSGRLQDRQKFVAVGLRWPQAANTSREFDGVSKRAPRVGARWDRPNRSVSALKFHVTEVLPPWAVHAEVGSGKPFGGVVSANESAGEVSAKHKAASKELRLGFSGCRSSNLEGMV